MNAVIYARYSSSKQTEQSIEGQLHDCYAYADRTGFNIVGEYIDRGISGKTDDRPEFQRMITDAAKKQFDRILVWKLDRFARNRYDSAVYKHKLKKYGVRVISVMENVGEGDESILLEALLEASAEYYSLDLKRKIKRGQRETIAKGRFCGGTIPYGYKSVDGKLVIDEAKAPNIRYVFEQYARGVSMKEIIDELNSRGVRGYRDGRLTYTTFSRAIRNPVYIGKYRYMGELVPNLAEQMIDEETFEAVQRRAEARAHAPAAAKAKEQYLLQGKIFCGECGANMVGESGYGRQGAFYNYYACADKKKRHTCKKKNERKDAIEDFVIRQTIEYVLAPSNMDQLVESIMNGYEREFDNTKIRDTEKEIKRLDHDLNKLVDSLIDMPKSAHKRIAEKMELLEAQKAALEDDLVKLRIARKVKLTKAEVRAWLMRFCSGDIHDERFRQDLVDTFVNSVYVFDDRIAVFYNLPNSARPRTSSARASAPSSTSSKVSDLLSGVSPRQNKSDSRFIFNESVFGFVFYGSIFRCYK